MKFYNTVFLLALLPATVLGQTPGNLYGACAEDSDCRSGLTCYTIGTTICLHGETNTNQGCTVASDCGTGFCDLGTPHSGSGSPGTCTGCSDVSDCNGTGGIGGAIGCLTTICLVGSEFIPIMWRIILWLKSSSKSCFFFLIIRFGGCLCYRH